MVLLAFYFRIDANIQHRIAIDHRVENTYQVMRLQFFHAACMTDAYLKKYPVMLPDWLKRHKNSKRIFRDVMFIISDIIFQKNTSVAYVHSLPVPVREDTYVRRP
jgi:hypothetical protein